MPTPARESFATPSMRASVTAMWTLCRLPTVAFGLLWAVGCVHDPAPTTSAGHSPSRVQARPQARVEVERVIADPGQVSVFLTAINPMEQDLMLALTGRDAQGGYPNIYVMDSQGRRYEFMNASGLRGGWLGNGFSADTAFLIVPPNDRARIGLRFKGHGRAPTSGTVFTLVGALVRVDWDETAQPRPAETLPIEIPGLEPS